jgi:HSP20 family molecular chaperone IbpA
MPRLTLFNSPLLLGFDQFERAFERVSKAAADGYPPYNVEQTGENSLRITLAVAGFTMGDRVYLHRGIAARQFQRSFVLAEGIEVASASLDNGLLNIDLVRVVVEGRVRNVEIKGPAKAGRQVIEHGTDK